MGKMYNYTEMRLGLIEKQYIKKAEVANEYMHL